MGIEVCQIILGQASQRRNQGTPLVQLLDRKRVGFSFKKAGNGTAERGKKFGDRPCAKKIPWTFELLCFPQVVKKFRVLICCRNRNNYDYLRKVIFANLFRLLPGFSRIAKVAAHLTDRKSSKQRYNSKNKK